MKISQFNKLEKSLIQKHSKSKENIVHLTEDDFQNGELSVFGYQRLKQQCDYIPYSEEIEITVSKQHKSFKDNLECMAAGELIRIKKERRELKIVSLLLFCFGVLLITLVAVLEFLKGSIFKEIIVIASWVFIWASVEKWFFDRVGLREKRLSLLHILSAKIMVSNTVDEGQNENKKL